MTKDTLIKGTLILTLAAFTARFLGLIQRVPLKHLLGDTGMASYGISYNLYHVVLIIATAGIPSALSKLISERMATGQHEEAQRIYTAAIWFAVSIGVLATAGVWFGAEFYAVHISRDAEAVLAIRALAPALLMFPLIAIMRGYFLGRQMMVPSGMSQIFEQFSRVITAVSLSYIILKLGYDKQWAVAGASFGGVTGGVAALGVMFFYWARLKKRDHQTIINQGQPSSLSITQIYVTIFKFSIPVSLIAITVPLIYLIDSSTVIALLEGRLGYEQAKETLGILTGRAQSLAGIPPILAIAVSQSIIPIISAAYAKMDMGRVNEQASQAFRLSFIACLPFILFLSIAARPVNGFLFGDTLGTGIIVALVIGTAFHVMMMISGAVLLGLGQTKAPMRFIVVGIVVKLGGSYALAPLLGIYGIVLATALCFLTITVLNVLALKRTVTLNILQGRWMGLMITVSVITLIGVGVEALLHHYVHVGLNWLTYGLHGFVLGLVIVSMYLLFLVKFRMITLEDIQRLPGPLHRVMLVVNKRLGEAEKS